MGQSLLGDSLWEVWTWVPPCHVVVFMDEIVWVSEDMPIPY